MNKNKDPVKFLKDLVFEVEKETKQETKDGAFLWVMHYDTWIDILGSVLNGISQSEAGNSMIILRLMELQKTILWLQICAFSGAYRPLIRELRFIFESFNQAYYLDKEYEKLNITEKHLILSKKDKELFGSKLVDKLDIKNKNEMKKLYWMLSKYSHSSYEELKPSVIDGKVEERILFEFDIDLFNICKDLTNQVIDLAFLMTFKKYPESIELFVSKPHSIYWLEQLNSKETLAFLKSNMKLCRD
ncbi:MAG: hypothetical protein HZA84_09320 [Thaumarchaeota archaeon]|nr:hypothetical protein [Nitrososphaerota archaeon]